MKGVRTKSASAGRRNVRISVLTRMTAIQTIARGANTGNFQRSRRYATIGRNAARSTRRRGSLRHCFRENAKIAAKTMAVS